MRRLVLMFLAVAALAAAGCGDDDSGSDGSSAPATQAEAKATPEKASGSPASGKQPKSAGSGLRVKTGDSEFGTILFDGEDRAIYLFDKETSPTSECYGACAEAWPPVLTKGEPQAVPGARASMLGTTKRDDGSTQVTYKGHPLYYYVDDPPGQVLCHDVVEFGGLWLVVQQTGDPVAPS